MLSNNLSNKIIRRIIRELFELTNLFVLGNFFRFLSVKSSTIFVLGIVNFLWTKFHYFHRVPVCPFCFIWFRCENFPAFPCLDRHFPLWYDPFTNFCSTTEYSKDPSREGAGYVPTAKTFLSTTRRNSGAIQGRWSCRQDRSDYKINKTLKFFKADYIRG